MKFRAKLKHRFESFGLDISLDLGDGIGVLFGPSGAGKSLALRLIAGLIRPEEGHISLGNRILYQNCPNPVWIPPQQRRIGYVFQHHALFPHMTAVQNIMYGARKIPKGEAREKAHHIIGEFQLKGLEKRYPSAVSGGQKQRIAFARALIGNPELLLLDEPFSALDSPTRHHMRDCLRHVMRARRIPILMVTHDLSEAVALAQTIFVCINGSIKQAGHPNEVIKNPSTEAVQALVHFE